MYKHLTRTILIPAVAVGLLVFTHSTQAQGTATGPITNHNVDPGPIVVIGDPTNPIPIDLDPLGPPWTKIINDPNFILINGGPLNLDETIINVGNEPWYDWHEHIMPDATGTVPGLWVNVSLAINGNPIGFNAIGLGTSDLWLDTFSQPILPGDVLNVRKIIDVKPGIPGVPNQPIVIEEYPTPEPASLALLGLGTLAVLGRRKGGI